MVHLISAMNKFLVNPSYTIPALVLNKNTFYFFDIVNIGLHFFLKDVRPMLPPVMNRSIVDA